MNDLCRDGRTRLKRRRAGRSCDAIVDTQVTVFSTHKLQRRHSIKRITMPRNLSRQFTGIGAL